MRLLCEDDFPLNVCEGLPEKLKQNELQQTWQPNLLYLAVVPHSWKLNISEKQRGQLVSLLKI